jgi:flavin reductase (DIM6/NTAB) family NADH-FMN oxidoreductase RutF
MSSDPGGSSHEPVSRDLFRRACGRFITGVAIASVIDSAGRPHGLTINSFTSVSLEPPLVLICLGHQAAALAAFRDARTFGVSILELGQVQISERFARYSDDRFEGTSWHTGAHNTPLVDGAIATLECRLERWFAAGDHDVFLGEVVAAELFPGEPLTFFAGDYRQLS